MTTKPGMGITFSIEDVGSPGTYNAIATVIDADWPALRKILMETTAHDTTDGYRTHQDTGLREMSEFAITLGWDDGEILEINQVVSYFNYANRTVTGLGVGIDGDILGLSPNDSDDPDNWGHS